MSWRPTTTLIKVSYSQGALEGMHVYRPGQPVSGARRRGANTWLSRPWLSRLCFLGPC